MYFCKYNYVGRHHERGRNVYINIILASGFVRLLRLQVFTLYRYFINSLLNFYRRVFLFPLKHRLCYCTYIYYWWWSILWIMCRNIFIIYFYETILYIIYCTNVIYKRTNSIITLISRRIPHYPHSCHRPSTFHASLLQNDNISKYRWWIRWTLFAIKSVTTQFVSVNWRTPIQLIAVHCRKNRMLKFSCPSDSICIASMNYSSRTLITAF